MINVCDHVHDPKSPTQSYKIQYRQQLPKWVCSLLELSRTLLIHSVRGIRTFSSGVYNYFCYFYSRPRVIYIYIIIFDKNFNLIGSFDILLFSKAANNKKCVKKNKITTVRLRDTVRRVDVILTYVQEKPTHICTCRIHNVHTDVIHVKPVRCSSLKNYIRFRNFLFPARSWP